MSLPVETHEKGKTRYRLRRTTPEINFNSHTTTQLDREAIIVLVRYSYLNNFSSNLARRRSNEKFLFLPILCGSRRDSKLGMTEIFEIVESTASPSSKTTKTTRRSLTKSEAKTPQCRQLAWTWSTPSTIAIAQRLMLRNDLPLETIMLSFGSLGRDLGKIDCN